MEHVIFDTNAYRYLVKGKSYEDIDGYLKKIKSKEKRNGISTFISPIVARELLAHLADKKDPSFDICLNATKAMYLHSSDEDGSQYNMIASPELLIAKMYFGTSIPRKEQTYQALIQIAYHLAKKPSKYNFTKFQKNLNDNRFDVLQTENVFAQSIFDFMKSQDPISSGWDFFKEDPEKRRKLLQIVRSDQFTIEIVSGLILSVYFLLQQERLIDQKLTEQEFIEYCENFIESFPEYIALYRLVFENVINSNFNIFEESRGNFIWDIQLMMNVGKHSVNGNKLYFVTSDKAIISTALKENNNNVIFTFDEYMDFLGM